MAHQYMPKIFHDPHKNPPAPLPTYLMYGPLSCAVYNKNWSNNNKKLSKKNHLATKAINTMSLKEERRTIIQFTKQK